MNKFRTFKAKKQTLNKGTIKLEFDSQALINITRDSIFGSEINFKFYRDSKEEFPIGYKFCVDGILKGFIQDETTLRGILKNIPMVKNVYKPRFERKKQESVKPSSPVKNKILSGKVTSELYEKLVTVDNELIKKGGKGGCRIPRDPLEYDTYKKRVSVIQATARGAEITEEYVSLIAKEYTENYNKRFKTNFSTYHSKKREVKVCQAK